MIKWIFFFCFLVGVALLFVNWAIIFDIISEWNELVKVSNRQHLVIQLCLKINDFCWSVSCFMRYALKGVIPVACVYIHAQHSITSTSTGLFSFKMRLSTSAHAIFNKKKKISTIESVARVCMCIPQTTLLIFFFLLSLWSFVLWLSCQSHLIVNFLLFSLPFSTTDFFSLDLILLCNEICVTAGLAYAACTWHSQHFHIQWCNRE